LRVYLTGTEGGVERTASFLASKRVGLEGYIAEVYPLVRDVSARCYEAVREYSEKLDGASFEDPRIGRREMEDLASSLDDALLEALREVAGRVKRYARALIPKPLSVGKISVRWVPVERVAVYVPGGRRPYPSTALMTVSLASAAGVSEVVVLTPPCRGCGSKADPRVVAASLVAGASSVYAVGGPQGVAGVAYGCKPLPRVQKIVGPGGPHVQAAKILVSHLVGIDMVAGPTELFIIADSTADPGAVALEALAQGEHGPTSIVVVASPDEALLARVRSLLEGQPGEGMAPVVLVRTRSLEEAARLADSFAPEHLLVEAEDPEGVAGMVRNAGMVSLRVPTAYIDYVAGPSHVLPTGGAAAWRGGLTVMDFLKPLQLVRGMDPGLIGLAKLLASCEGFAFHYRSLEAWTA
jgi:histidinol dehydrogenase